MAPYRGPTLASLLPLLKKGLPETVGLGHGTPSATLQRADGGFELRRRSGGEGFGVQADLMSPFVDEGVAARTAEWQAIFAWLCEHWEKSWGPAMDKTERVRVTFTGDARAVGTALHRELAIPLADGVSLAEKGLVAETLDAVAGACRAARTAHAEVDFALARVKVRYDVVLVDAGRDRFAELNGGPHALLAKLVKHARLSRARAQEVMQSLPAVVYTSQNEIDANHVRSCLAISNAVRLELVERVEEG